MSYNVDVPSKTMAVFGHLVKG